MGQLRPKKYPYFLLATCEAFIGSNILGQLIVYFQFVWMVEEDIALFGIVHLHSVLRC